ncbi:protein TPX2-like isoform X2 [Mercurialis annua]|uniref:protein TPX2-like isoform X2 n=1 Tax=Mercurialis annua TaxID=3986 RepID=UPI002160A8B5|nr:protein TPX2-like isoform X2 [Mercurialis annua]
MEIEMEMEEEEMEMELVFEAREVDIDYEFDAAMHFDFTRAESLAEARDAERWFDMAQSYPPSPFVTKLVVREQSVISEDCKGGLLHTEAAPAMEVQKKECERTYRGVFTNLQNSQLHKVSNKPPALPTDLTSYNNTYTGLSKTKAKSNLKPKLPRSSTLMKPTASVLAKQNRHPQVDGFRLQPLFDQKEKSICSSSAVESQAAKRQKLEGGHSRKVDDAMQQIDFIHKAPKRDGVVDKTSVQSRLRLTIPREPDLVTAHRAQRMRPKTSTEVEPVAVLAQRFKARPLNRKILEGPSLPLPKKSTPKLPEFQEFHLKTLERAMQHASAVSSSSLQHNDFEQVEKPNAISAADIGKREFRRPSTMNAPKQQDVCSAPLIFKARSLNKKIFTSKGDIGVFRNSKRETTVPTEFNFHTEKRSHHNPPPIDLFSKLSLTSELQPNNNGCRLQFPRPNFMSIKKID